VLYGTNGKAPDPDSRNLPRGGLGHISNGWKEKREIVKFHLVNTVFRYTDDIQVYGKGLTWQAKKT